MQASQKIVATLISKALAVINYKIMSDFFDDFNKIFKKDLMPIFSKYINDPQILLTKIIDKLSINKDSDNNSRSYAEVENIAENEVTFDDEYDDLFRRLTLIEENMSQIEKLLKDQN